MKKIVTFLLAALMLTLASCGETKSNAPTTAPSTVIPAKEALAEAKKSGLPIIHDMKCTANADVFYDFAKKTSAGENATVVCAFYYTLDNVNMDKALYEEEKDKYPQLFYYTVDFDGEYYTVTTRKSDEATPDRTERFRYMMHYTGQAPDTAVYSEYEYYVLTDDDTVTWEDIEWGLLSSQANAGVRHCMIFQNVK